MNLRKFKVGLFAERKNTTAALKYAQSMFRAEESMAVTTSIMVYHNTLMEQLAKAQDEENKDIDRRATIVASGQVLYEHLPIDFDSEDFECDEGSIDEWVEAHAWEPFQYWSAEPLWEQIDSVATTLKDFNKHD